VPLGQQKAGTDQPTLVLCIGLAVGGWTNSSRVPCAGTLLFTPDPACVCPVDEIEFATIVILFKGVSFTGMMRELMLFEERGNRVPDSLIA